MSEQTGKLPKISRRLAAAAEYVRQGAVIADVGTDHAYLPIFLCLSGKAVGGVASDIHKGPLKRAEENIRAYGLSDKLEILLCDGLDGIALRHPTDILILGMGGELIADILRRADFTRQAGIRLILQPMTHPEILRRFLAQNGYKVCRESLVQEDRIYQIICAEYTGETVGLAPLSALVGEQNLYRGDVLTFELLRHWKSVFSVRVEGKKSAGSEASEEEALLFEIDSYIACRSGKGAVEKD